MNLSEIYEGWKNHLLPEENSRMFIEYVSQERTNICLKCEEHSFNKPGYKSIRPDAHCTDCGCTLLAKTKCLSCECPLKKWGAVDEPNNSSYAIS